MRKAWIPLLVAGALLTGCRKPQPALPPPHALDDAAAASQRASAAMQTPTNPSPGTSPAAEPSVDSVQSETVGIQ